MKRATTKPQRDSPWLTTEAAAHRLGKTPNAFRIFKSRYNRRVPPKQRLRTYCIGGMNLFKVTDIDRLVQHADTAPVFDEEKATAARRSA